MALTTSLVSVEEYLNTNYKPACEYRDGVLTRKPMATHEHSRLQGRFIQILLNRYPEFAALPELTLQLRPDRYLIPDIGVESLADVQMPYPVRPIHLCIEILSPGDRLAEAAAKCEEYSALGVPHNWVVDPQTRRAWKYLSGQGLVEIPPSGSLEAGIIHVSLSELFAVL